MKLVNRRAFLVRAGAGLGLLGTSRCGRRPTLVSPGREPGTAGPAPEETDSPPQEDAPGTRGQSGRAAPVGRYARNLARLAEWVARSFVGGQISLVPNLPSGKIRSGRDRVDLKNLYWLQNCNLYAMVALRPYDGPLARRIEKSYRRWYAAEFADVEEDTEHYLTLGKLPRVTVPKGRYLRNIVKVKEFGGYRVGTETCDPGKLGRILPDDPRTLLKYGALRAQLEGDAQLAREYFDRAMGLWDGRGFPMPARSKRHESYRTRNLAYALIAARALGATVPTKTREAIEHRLWACQDDGGGIWTNYNADGTIPGLAKKTAEIGPLALLAYDEGVWPRRA